MSVKIFSLILAGVGLIVLAAVVLIGMDLDRATRTGPAWKRRLLASGLALLAIVGLAPPRTAEGKTPSSAQPGPLLSSKQWKQIVAIWKEAREIGSGKRGSYPFNEAGKKRVLADLARAGKQVDALVAAGKISKAGGGLLKRDLVLLTHEVQGKRPREMRNATCYEPMMFTPARDSVRRLKARLPLLAALVKTKKVQVAVLKKVLVSIENNVGVLSQKTNLNRLKGKELKEAKRVLADAKRDLVKLKPLVQPK